MLSRIPLVVISLVAFVSLGTASSIVRAADQVDPARKLIDDGKFVDAVDVLKRRVADEPANEPARMLLAEAQEKAGALDDAMQTWRDLLKLSRVDEHLHTARKAISRMRRIQLDQTDIGDLDNREPMKDPFHIDMPEIDWKGLEVIEDSKYIPSPIPEDHPFEVPPFPYVTKHFTVYAANERYAKEVGERAELYLQFMLEKLFAGRAWAVRFPIFVYTTEQDYVQHGAPAGSHGVTFGHATGKSTKIMIFQIRPEDERGRGGGGDKPYKYALESILPHELTHAVINEFFGRQEIPQWLHEAVAGRFEQTRNHNYEAARLARQVVAGEYFRMRDLFEQKGYPERVGLFYEQSAIVVLYLFEAGPEAMNAFLTELANGNDHDAACAAALGIPKEGAVEEFEKRWVEWMKVRYIKDLDRKLDDTQMADAAVSYNKAFAPWVNELDTVASITNWRTIDTGSLDQFSGVGKSKEQWSAGGGVLRCEPAAADGASVLGIRMNEVAPVAISFDVKYLGSPGASSWFGLTQLDADSHDTPIEVLARLPDGAPHKVVGLWTDDLVLYVDDVCIGRYPARQIRGNMKEVDYPIALVAHGPVEVQNLRVATIQKFSDKPVVVAEAPKKEEPGKDKPKEGERRRGSRRERNKPASPEPSGP